MKNLYYYILGFLALPVVIQAQNKMLWSAKIGHGKSWNYGIFDAINSTPNSTIKYNHSFYKDNLNEIGIEMRYGKRLWLDFEYQHAYFARRFFINLTDAGTFWHPNLIADMRSANRGRINILTLKIAIPFKYSYSSIFSIIPKFGLQYSYTHWKNVVPYYQKVRFGGIAIPDSVLVIFHPETSTIINKSGINAVGSIDMSYNTPIADNRLTFYVTMLYSQGLMLRAKSSIVIEEQKYAIDDYYSYFSMTFGLKYRISKYSKKKNYDK